jgi:hypothetical protein
MRQEAERQVGACSDATQAAMERPHQAGAVVRAQVDALLALDVAPERFDGIEFGGVGGQPFDGEPVPLRGEVALHDPAAVRRQAIPEQDRPLAMEVAMLRDTGKRGNPDRLPFNSSRPAAAACAWPRRRGGGSCHLQS